MRARKDLQTRTWRYDIPHPPQWRRVSMGFHLSLNQRQRSSKPRTGSDLLPQHSSCTFPQLRTRGTPVPPQATPRSRVCAPTIEYQSTTAPAGSGGPGLTRDPGRSCQQELKQRIRGGLTAGRDGTASNKEPSERRQHQPTIQSALNRALLFRALGCTAQ